MKLKEILASLSVVVSIVAVPLVVSWYHGDRVLGAHAEGTRVITLSGVAESGVWTTERVNGTNYW